MPIATGERFAGPEEFKAQFVHGGVRFARESPCVCGGITGARKAAAIAEAFDIQIAPHNPLSPVSLAACLQLAASVPNFAIQEYPTGFENLVLRSQAGLLGESLVHEAPRVDSGFVRVPDAPGIGITLKDDVEQLRAPLFRSVSMRSGIDGAPIDQ